MPDSDNYSRSIVDGKGRRYYVSTTPDYEFKDPWEYLWEVIVNSKYRLMQIIAKAEGIIEPRALIRKTLILRAVAEFNELYKGMLATDLPPNLVALLSTERKKDQIRLTRGMGITAVELNAFIAQSGKSHGFTYSQYRSQHYPKGLNTTKLPKFIHQKNDGTINSIGETTMSTGELKNVIAHRKVLIGKFLDKGEDWHCFVYTYKSLDGTEDGDWGSHIHYMSSKWGVAREDVVAGIKEGRYVASGLPHIRFDRGSDEIEGSSEPEVDASDTTDL